MSAAFAASTVSARSTTKTRPASMATTAAWPAAAAAIVSGPMPGTSGS